MVQGKLIMNSGGEIKETTLDQCNMFIGFGIRKEKTPDGECYCLQRVILDGDGLSRGAVIKALAEATVDTVAKLSNNELFKAITTLDFFSDKVAEARDAKLLELSMPIVEEN